MSVKRKPHENENQSSLQTKTMDTNNFRYQLPPASSLWYPEIEENKKLFADDLLFKKPGQNKSMQDIENGPPVFNGTRNTPPKFLCRVPVFPSPPKPEKSNVKSQQKFEGLF